VARPHEVLLYAGLPVVLSTDASFVGTTNTEPCLYNLSNTVRSSIVQALKCLDPCKSFQSVSSVFQITDTFAGFNGRG
jgi:hypothetical protein